MVSKKYISSQTQARRVDRIPPRVSKGCSSELVLMHAHLFCFSLKAESFPSLLGKALVQPNYHPTALVSTFSKSFETHLNSHFLANLESQSRLYDHQSGFRKVRSIDDILSNVTSIWSSSLEDLRIHIVALDSWKAFDRLWHGSQIHNFPSFGCFSSLSSFTPLSIW